MIITLSDLINWLHLTPFELAIHLIGIFVSLLMTILWDEGILNLITGKKERSTHLWIIFIPLWCPDIITAYFNLIIFFRRIHYHKVINYKFQLNCYNHRGLSRPPWSSIILDRTYALLCCFCSFVFKYLLYQKLVLGEHHNNLTWGMIFAPIICLMQLILLSICVKVCRGQGLRNSTN